MYQSGRSNEVRTERPEARGRLRLDCTIIVGTSYQVGAFNTVTSWVDGYHGRKWFGWVWSNLPTFDCKICLDHLYLVPGYSPWAPVQWVFGEDMLQR